MPSFMKNADRIVGGQDAPSPIPWQVWLAAEIYIQSAPNNSNEIHTFMCLGRAGRFGQH